MKTKLCNKIKHWNDIMETSAEWLNFRHYVQTAEIVIVILFRFKSEVSLSLIIISCMYFWLVVKLCVSCLIHFLNGSLFILINNRSYELPYYEQLK